MSILCAHMHILVVTFKTETIKVLQTVTLSYSSCIHMYTIYIPASVVLSMDYTNACMYGLKCILVLIVFVLHVLQFCESELTLRSRSMHTSHCTHLEGPLHDHFATTYGVSCKSILNESQFFHVVDSLIPDIMHDILEGSLQLHIKWLLRHYIIHMKYFSINILNGRIRSFNFGTAERSNRPTCIAPEVLSSSQNSVKQSCKLQMNEHSHLNIFLNTASQAWCLGRFLPLLLGDLIPEQDEYWSAYLIFLRIMEYTFAPVLTPDKLDYLQTLIQDFLIEFVRLYPDRPLTPKLHYLLHVVGYMKRLVTSHT